MKWKGFFDGAAQPTNPGPAGIGALILNGDGKVCWKESLYIGEQTNNYTEYVALIKLLEKCETDGIDEIIIHGDSQLVINQMNQIYQVKSKNIRPLYNQAQKLAQVINNVTFKWIPRDQNEKADELSKKALQDINYVQFEKISG